MQIMQISMTAFYLSPIISTTWCHSTRRDSSTCWILFHVWYYNLPVETLYGIKTKRAVHHISTVIR